MTEMGREERVLIFAPTGKDAELTCKVLEASQIRLDVAPRARQQEFDTFLPEGMSLDEFEQNIIKEALKRANGNKSHAARLLGLTRNALRYRLSQMGLES